MSAVLFVTCLALAGIVFSGLMAGKAEKPGKTALWSIAGCTVAALAGIAIFCMRSAILGIVFKKLSQLHSVGVTENVVITNTQMINIGFGQHACKVDIPDIVMIHLGVIVFLAGLLIFLWCFNCRRNVSPWYCGLLWSAGLFFLTEHILFLPLYYGAGTWMYLAYMPQNDHSGRLAILPLFYGMHAVILFGALLWTLHTLKTSRHSWKNILAFTGCFTGLTAVLWFSAWGAGLWAEKEVLRKASELKIQAFRIASEPSPEQKKRQDEIDRFHSSHPKYHPPRSGLYNWIKNSVPPDVREYTLKMYDSPEMNRHLDLLRESSALLAQKDTLRLDVCNHFRALVRYSADKAELYQRSGEPEKAMAELMKYPATEAMIPADTPFLIYELVRTAARAIWVDALVQYGPNDKKFLANYRKLLEWSNSWQVNLPCEAGFFLGEPRRGKMPAEYFFGPCRNAAAYRGFSAAVERIPRLERLRRQEVVEGNDMFAVQARRHRQGIVLGRTAIALKLYRIEHGQYPEKISELAPEYLPKEYCSPKDGKALSYSVENGEFSLSVDADRIKILSKR